MKNKIKYYAMFFALLTGTALSAQKIDSALNVLLTNHPSEKIYIHYDKEYYVTGETIWFKAYLYSQGEPSDLSSNFYLQLTDSKGNIIRNQKYPVMGAVIKGNIDIPDSLPQGNYYIRAITPHMLNYDEGFVYRHNLFIFKSNTPATVATTSSTISLHFFPESGHLVDGILSVVGFKATDQWGIPADVEGIIKSEDGVTIASFKSFHDGIGKVQFKPQAGKKYLAEVETASGKRTYSLPEVQSSGINLRVQDEKGGKKFQLSRSEKEKDRFENLWLAVQINNHVVFETEIAFEDYPSIIGHLLTDSLPSGILHFTVFTKDRMPLAERICFLDNGEYKGAADIAVIKQGTEKRSENILEIIFPKGIQRSCSVAVIDLPGKSFNNNDNIWSRFLLTSDVKGYIHNPAWYFENQNDTTKLALDNLLLTHGWSRFNWTKILSKGLEPARFVDKGLISISGIVLNPKTKEPLAYGKAGFIIEGEDSTSQTIEAVVGADGRFRLDSIVFFGKTNFYYGYSDKNQKVQPAVVVLDENAMEKQIIAIPENFSTTAGLRNPALLQNKDEVNLRHQQVQAGLDEVKELENVNVNAIGNKKPIDEVNEKYTTGAFKGQAKEVIDNINEPITDKSLNAIDLIKNRVQQVEFNGGGFVSRKNFSLMSGQKWAVGIFLNEQLTDVFMLRTLRAADIALVKFFDAGFVGVGSTYPGGAISIYTKEKFAEEQKPDKLEFVEYNGYTIRKEFYSPDYSNTNIRHPQSDKRTTLYWNPDIFTDMETRVVKLNFYNNDVSKRFKIIVEGFDAAGKLLHIEKIIGDK